MDTWVFNVQEILLGSKALSTLLCRDKVDTIFLGGRELLCAQDPRWEVKQCGLSQQLNTSAEAEQPHSLTPQAFCTLLSS